MRIQTYLGRAIRRDAHVAIGLLQQGDDLGAGLLTGNLECRLALLPPPGIIRRAPPPAVVLRRWRGRRSKSIRI